MSGSWPEATGFLETRQGKFKFLVPQNGYYFNENDCWARVEGATARVGVSDFLQQQGGDVTFLELPEIGKKIALFEEITALETMKTVIPLISPLPGRVRAVNAQLLEKPELINQSPYHLGWIAELEVETPETDLLLTGPAYLELLKEKLTNQPGGTNAE